MKSAEIKTYIRGVCESFDDEAPDIFQIEDFREKFWKRARKSRLKAADVKALRSSSKVAVGLEAWDKFPLDLTEGAVMRSFYYDNPYDEDCGDCSFEVFTDPADSTILGHLTYID